MNRLHSIVLICSLVCAIIFGGSKAFADELISRYIDQDFTLYDTDHVFTKPDSLWFYVPYELKYRGEWSIGILQKSGEYSIHTPKDSRNHSIVVNFSELDYRTAWQNAEHLYDEGNDRYLLEAKISFKVSDGREDHLLIKLALLPEIPKYSNINFSYEYDWNHDTIWPNGYFSFDATTSGADTYWLHVSYSNLFEPPVDGLFFSWCDRFEVKQPISKISYDAEWGEYLTVQVQNPFGYVSGEILFTTDYINDTAILTRLEELRHDAHVNDIVSESSIPVFELTGYSIKFNTTVRNICLYDLNGRLIQALENGQCVCIDQLNSGLYILAYEYNSKQYKNKIIL